MSRGEGSAASSRSRTEAASGRSATGANVVPSGEDTARFADVASEGEPRMVVGEERAVTELWRRCATGCRSRSTTVPQPVYARREPPEAGRERAACGDARRSRPARPGGRPRLPRGGRRRRLRARSRALRMADAHRSSRAGAGSGARTAGSSSRPRRRPGRSGRSSSSRSGSSRSSAAADTRSAGSPISAGCFSAKPRPCLFVRPENAPALALYDSIGMRRTITYRSLIFS